MTDQAIPVVVLQVRRGSQWSDFSHGSFAAAARHIEQNPAGVWRGIDPFGNVVIPPRQHTHSPLFGVSTDGVATCECGRRITLADGSWNADWPRREDREGISPKGSEHHGTVHEDKVTCSCGWSSEYHARGSQWSAFRRHLDRVTVSAT